MIAEWRRACIELGILQEQDRHLVTNVNGPLPTSSQQEGETQAGTAKESDDERRLFITLLSRVAPLTLPARASSHAYNPEVAEELMRNSTRTTRKRSKHRGPSQGGEKRPRKTLLNYFSQR